MPARKKKPDGDGKAAVVEAPASKKKKKHLVIVESPAKAKTINKYLGTDYEVAASKGHVRDLPMKKFGINIDKGWLPTYQILEDRKAVLSDLKKMASKADTVFLAPDPDREGEAIAWHLKEALGLKDERTRRVTFNEITKRAITDAFDHPTDINMDKVAAQEARRFLDRVVGYKLSPLLRKKVAKGLSAGRVQSVAVRLIVEREREIQKFQTEEYWKVIALLKEKGKGKRPEVELVIKKAKGKEEADPDQDEVEKPAEVEVPKGAFLAELAEWAGQKFEAKAEDDVRKIAEDLLTATYAVGKIEQKERQERPQAPFITSTLQQQGSIRLRFSAKKTMMLAQRLYEGVDLGGEGSTALITYMRTDSTRVSDDALKSVRGLIEKQHGKDYLPDKPNSFATGKGAQEAHEAIRPTDLSQTPAKVGKHLPKDLHQLYSLIYNRFVASQMAPAVFAVTNVEVTGAQGLFKSQGRIMKFDGYRKVLPPAGKQEDALLPELAEKQVLDLVQLTGSQHFTQPPPRYSEASLVKSLEKEGIGRPSTYAAIISKIQERNYVEQRERRFFATEMGMLVTDMLVQHFPHILDLKFTSKMEGELDDIEEHKAKRDDVLEEFYGPFRLALETAETNMQAVKGVETGEPCPKCQKPLVWRYSKKTGKFAGCSGYPECDYTQGANGEVRTTEITDVVCSTCGKAMIKRMSRRGPFLGCSGYPECKTTMNFDAEGKPVLASRPTNHVCEKCNSPMVIREGRRGPFLACTGYPKCRNAKNVDAEGNPIEPIITGIACEKCGAMMSAKPGPRGPFLGCSAYPKCRSTKPMPADLKEQFKDKFPAPAKKAVPAIEIDVSCPDCGAPMKLRPGRRGFFLGCSKYPKCKGTQEAPAEVLEKVEAG